MGQLEDMAVFTKVVESGSITKAAQQLNLAKSAVSRRLADLESKLGVQLLIRTTRHSKVTDEGRQFYKDAKDLIQNVEALNEKNWQSDKLELSGSLRIAVPLDFGQLHLFQFIAEFSEQHPKLDIQINLSDGQVNLVEDGYELALRITQLKDSTFHARKIASVNHIVAANRRYLNKWGEPKCPKDLVNHKVLQYENLTMNILRFVDQNGHEHTATIKPSIRANNGSFLSACAASGAGIVCMPRFILSPHIENGSLVPILGNFTLPQIHLYALYAYAKYTPLKVRKLIDFLNEKLQGMSL
jgi:DNA-binding transcriptional LysR family regulator